MTLDSATSTRGHCWRGMRADADLVVADAALIALAYVTALAMRFDGAVPERYWRNLAWVLGLVVLLHVGALAVAGLYGRVWVQAGVAEVLPLLLATGLATLLVLGLDLASGDPRLLPLSVPLNAGALLLLLFAAVRYRKRLAAARTSVRTHGCGAGVVVVGRVARARHVIAQMQDAEDSLLRPVAVLTDEVQMWNRRLCGVPVCGPVTRLPEVAAELGATRVLLASGDDAAALRRGVDLARQAGLHPLVLPSLRETLGRRPGLRDVRDPSVEDLLGREQVPVDLPALRATITGRRVLITGAGGSIGSEIAVQTSRLQPAELVLLDHDETHLHDVMARLPGPARSVLGDIRDPDCVERLFASFRPEVVFHAAAHKHVPILEDFPSEAVRTNIVGTRLLVQAAARHGTQRFVAISTDKAVEPSSIMGASKRLAEQVLVQHAPEGRQFCAVRFGNVLGSRGSVIPTFLRQLQEGGPVTVTHPEMTRFFMSVGEAVELVMQAATLSEGGEVFLLDMGEPVRILDLAERLIAMSAAQSGQDVRIEFTGLRPGEKLTEVLHSRDEDLLPTAHSKVRLVRSPRCADELLHRGVDELHRLAALGEEQRVRELLLELARMPAEIHLDGAVLSALRRPAAVAPAAPQQRSRASAG